MDQENNARYRTVLYMRLSKDDESGEESASIASQRRILTDYAKTMGFCVQAEYSDDGYSGTTYDRPAFGQMVRDIESGKLDCILVKDLSRLGRNSARTTDLLDEYFPMHGVRLISVTDGYDSLHLTSGIAMSTAFLVTLHEMYARDISTKIRTSLRAKMQNGDYIASFAPYGYRKNPKNKNHLIADEETAPIIREIFKMAASGDAPHVIAERLRCDRIATPANYRISGHLYASDAEHCRWSSSMLCKLLANITYCGHTVQGKTRKLSFKSKRSVCNPREDWILVKDTHEPLISQELFDVARSRCVARRCAPRRCTPRRCTPRTEHRNLFAGIAVCADCGHAMTTAPSRKKGTTCNLCCGSYKAHGAGKCGNHFIDYDLLCEIVKEELRRQLDLPSDARRELLERLADSIAKSRGDALAEHAKMRARMEKLKRMLADLYKDLAEGKVNEAVYETVREDYQAELAQLVAKLDETAQSERGDPSHDAMLAEFCRCEALTRELVQCFIERIEVEQGSYTRDADGKRLKEQCIRIYYRF